MSDCLLVSSSGPVTTLTLNRPEPRRNPLTEEMLTHLRARFAELAEDPACRVVILTGAGSSFSSGADLGGPDVKLEDITPAVLQRMAERRGSTIAMVVNFPKPVIAAVNGPAVGPGCNLALACDLIVASDKARFGQLTGRRGIAPDWGASWLLPRLMDIHKAKEFMFSPVLVDAAKAAELGFVNRVVPAEQLMDEAHMLAESIARNAPLSLMTAKRMINRSYEVTLDAALEQEAQATGFLWSSQDSQEGIQAFMEKREPDFRGV